MHSDHVEGLPAMMQIRWHFASAGPKVDLACSDDAKSPRGHTLSCKKYAKHIGDALIESGEMAQRIAENNKRKAGGPADLINVVAFPMGAASQGPYKIPGGSLTEADYKSAVTDGGFEGITIVGTDLVSIRLPAE